MPIVSRLRYQLPSINIRPIDPTIFPFSPHSFSSPEINIPACHSRHCLLFPMRPITLSLRNLPSGRRFRHQHFSSRIPAAFLPSSLHHCRAPSPLFASGHRYPLPGLIPPLPCGSALYGLQGPLGPIGIVLAERAPLPRKRNQTLFRRLFRLHHSLRPRASACDSFGFSDASFQLQGIDFSCEQALFLFVSSITHFSPS